MSENSLQMHGLTAVQNVKLITYTFKIAPVGFGLRSNRNVND